MPQPINTTVKQGLIKPGFFSKPLGTSTFSTSPITGQKTTQFNAPSSASSYSTKVGGLSDWDKRVGSLTPDSVPGISTPPANESQTATQPANFVTPPARPDLGAGAGSALGGQANINTTGMKAPAGMEYNGQGQLVPIQQQTSQTNPNSYAGLVGRVAGMASQPSDLFKSAQESALGYQGDLKRIREERAGGVFNTQNSGTPLSQALGQAGAINNLYAAREGAAASAFQGASSLLPSATAQQNAQIQGLVGAAGLAAPQQVPYSNQYVDPTTGQPVSGGGGTTTGVLSQLPAQAQSAVQSYAEQVNGGRMTRADAESRLSAYGIAGTNALNEALGTGFNTNASNASASTTQQGQQLQTAAHATVQALDSLQQLFNNLRGVQTGGIPLTNNIANWIAGALGSTALTQYNQTLHDARAQLQGVLTASGGATPTGAEAMAMTYLPDNMTAGQLTGAIANVKSLIEQKVSSFTQSGQQGGGSSAYGAPDASGGIIQTPYGAINPNL